LRRKERQKKIEKKRGKNGSRNEGEIEKLGRKKNFRRGRGYIEYRNNKN
jgi:hypothetical protein